MLPKLLHHVEATFPTIDSQVTQDQWDSALPGLIEEFAEFASSLVATLKMSMPRRFFQESVQEIVTTRHPSMVICELKFRPKSDYFEKMGREIPSPENPTGPHATGLELSIVLCHGYVSRYGRRRPACVSVDFGVWGSFERTCFGNLLRDHSYAIERLMGLCKLNFTTACWFENLNGSGLKNAFKLLGLYYENDDPESNFTVTWEIDPLQGKEEVAKSLLSLAALYDIAFGYCQPKRRRSRAFEYHTLLK